MTLKKAYLIIFFFCLCVSWACAQSNQVKGRVTFLDSIPIVSATVIVKSNKQEIFSDSLGNFRFNSSFPEKIKVKANGFIPETFRINKGDTVIVINLKLKSNRNAIKMATDNGHVQDIVKLETMVAAQEENDFSNYKTVFDIVVNSSSGVYRQGNDIIIRGKKSFGSDAALIILDGVEIESSSLNSISTATIQSVKVLKGSYAAIYGVRGANGVVEIRTKRGGEK